MLSYPGASADELAYLDLQLVWRDTRLQPLISPSSSGEGEAWPRTGDRALLLASVAEIATANGYNTLTATNVSRGAGLPRAIFKSLFSDAEECFVAAMEQRAEEAIAQAARAQAAGRTWPGGMYRAISALCDQLIGDPLLTSVCLAETFEPDSTGSRSRARLIGVVAELLNDSAPILERPSALSAEASTGAVWSLFHHHLIRALPLSSPQIAATLAFMALAPVIGAPATVAAIAAEQSE